VFDTNIVIVGNVLTAPEWRRTSNTNSLVANFKVASTARRLDRESGRWIDGNSLRVRVNCWRRLAEGIASSVTVGDPVVVVGRLYTRDWTDGEGNTRTMYEMEAVAVGHDLARGRGKFYRNRPTLGTSAVEDAEAESKVRGESADLVPDGEAPARYGDGLFDDGYPAFADVTPSGPAGYDPLATVRGGGFEPFDTTAGTGTVHSPDDELEPFGDGSGHDPLNQSFDPSPLDQSRLDPSPLDAAPLGGGETEPDELPSESGDAAGSRRARRSGRRIAVSA
jgi:single-strand DNA-binding protein